MGAGGERMNVRTERRFGVTATLSPEARRNLQAVRGSFSWDDLLDVLEMVCIEKETDLINTPASDEPAVLANHKMAKAAWQMFTHFQEKVNFEVSLYAEAAPSQPIPAMTREEMEHEHILNPTHFFEDDGGDESDRRVV
jgi:hypothetical protein